MVRGLYIAATGMLTQRNRLDTVANNIANAETAGYKSDIMVSRSFRDMLLERINDPSIISRTRVVGPLNTGVHIDQIHTRFEQGSMDVTENNMDFAIEGNGFFAVETSAGERYTRDGSFYITTDGYLVTSQGHYVLGENGRIQVGTSQFAVNQTGDIFVNEIQVDRFRIVDFEDLQGLRKQGDNLFMDYIGQGAIPAEGYGIRQGYLEMSNIDVARETVNMMEIYRNYESNQRVLKMIDGMLDKAVNEVGKV